MKEYYVYVKFSDGTWVETSEGNEVKAHSEPEALNIFINKLLDNKPTRLSDAHIVKTKVEVKPTQVDALNNRVNELTRQLNELDNIVVNLESKVYWLHLVAWLALGLAFLIFIF